MYDTVVQQSPSPSVTTRHFSVSVSAGLCGSFCFGQLQSCDFQVPPLRCRRVGLCPWAGPAPPMPYVSSSSSSLP